MVFAGLMDYEEREARSERVEEFNALVNNIFAIVQPEAHRKYERRKQQHRAETGVDEVIYQPEPEDPEELDELLRDFGFGE